MKILLLGASGLLGHNVLKQLLAAGHEVHALLRDSSSIHLPAEELNSPKFSTAPFPNSSPKLGEVPAGGRSVYDAIVNCIGCTDMSLRHYDDYLPANRDICARLVGLMEQQGITRLVHVSTANTIGYGTSGHPADEQAPMQEPFTASWYALSKREGEKLLDEAAARHPDWHIVTVHPGFMVGAYDVKPSSGALLLAAYRRPLMAAPCGGKSFLHVADAAAAIVGALTRGRHGGHYLLTGENLSLKEFYALQAEVCGYRQRCLTLPSWLVRAAGRAGDLLRLLGLRTQLSTCNVRQLLVREYYDNTLARRDLGMPATPLAQAIADFFLWRAQPR